MKVLDILFVTLWCVAETFACSDKEGTALWGHFYGEGGIEPMEFYTAERSNRFPCEPKYVVRADPFDACKPLYNKNSVQDAIVIASVDSECTIDTKVKNIELAGGVAAVLANSDNSLKTIPLAESTNISVVMVRQRTGLVLNYFFNSFGASFVGMLQGEYMNFTVHSLEKCGVCRETVTEAKLKKPVQLRAGMLQEHANNQKFEFFTASTGSLLPQSRELLLVLPETKYGCLDMILSSKATTAVRGKPFGLLVRRGKCTFATKLENAKAVNASFVVFSNEMNIPLTVPMINYEITNPSFDKTFSAASLLPSAMIRHAAAKKLREAMGKTPFIKITFKATSLSIENLLEIPSYTKMFQNEFWLKDGYHRSNQENELKEEAYKSLLGLSCVDIDETECINLILSERVAEISAAAEQSEKELGDRIIKE